MTRPQMTEKDENNIVNGTVLEALPNTQFRVELPDGSVVHTYLSGKMRIHHIKVLVGDNVSIKVDKYGEKGRIIKRL